MKKYLIDSSPEKYKDKWLIFNETIFDSIEMADCINTIEGVCYTDISIDDCIEKCDLNDNCIHGYYLTSKNNNSNICIPLYTPAFDKEQNYSYNLVNIKNYNIDYSGQAFLDTTNQVFPPQDNAYVSYNDTVKIQETNSNRFISIDPINNSMKVDLDSSATISFKITQPIDDTSYTSRNLKYGAEFLLIFKESNITFGIIESSKNLSTQTVTDYNRLTNKQLFNARPITYKKDNSIIKYFENFILNYYGNFFIKIDDNDNLVYTEEMSEATEFKFILQDPLHKCIDGKCKNIYLKENTDLTNVYSNNQCFNRCDENKSGEIIENYTFAVNKSNTSSHIIILSILMLLLIIILLFS